MRFRDAGPDEIERVLRSARSLRGGGPARENERFLVGCDGEGRLQAALILRSLPGALDGRPVRMAQVTEAFPVEGTLDDEIGAALQDEALRQAREGGHELSIMILETGSTGASPGFSALPCSESACRTFLPAPWPKEPAWLRAGEGASGRVPGLRPGRSEDIEAIASIHAEEIAGQRLRIDRDSGLWERILLGRDARRLTGGAVDPFWVIERSGRVDAYALLQARRPTLRWREHGARRGAEDLLPDLFWSALGWARGERLQRIEGWRMPDVLTLMPLYPTSNRRRRDNLAMLRTLGPVSQPLNFAREDECRLWELDVSWD